MKTKILITVEGGVLKSVGSTEPIDIVIVEFDKHELEYGVEVHGPESQDYIFRDGFAATDMFPPGMSDSSEIRAFATLADLKY